MEFKSKTENKMKFNKNEYVNQCALPYTFEISFEISIY